MNAENIQNCFYKTGLFGDRAQPQSDDGTKELQVILTEARCDVSADEYMESDDISITYTDNEKDLPMTHTSCSPSSHVIIVKKIT